MRQQTNVILACFLYSASRWKKHHHKQQKNHQSVEIPTKGSKDKEIRCMGMKFRTMQLEMDSSIIGQRMLDAKDTPKYPAPDSSLQIYFEYSSYTNATQITFKI